MNLNTCYTILGIGSDADGSQAKQAYKTQVKRWHPDQFPDGTPAQSDAEERLKQINIAYSRVKAHLAEKAATVQANAGRSASPRGRRTARAQNPSDTSTASRSWMDHLFTMFSSFSNPKPHRPSADASRQSGPNRKKDFGHLLNEIAGGSPRVPRSSDQAAKPAAGNRRNAAAYGCRLRKGNGPIGGIRPIEPVKPVRRVRGIGKSR
ncbi:MAG: hypothetical protein CSA23_05110 [Deltaproteobacteria bacterium]|nr:MAG: hypothetical protein CSA23_05110 [Deltaproteobacteria bacterium]